MMDPPVFRVVRDLAVDALYFVGLSFRSRTALIAENLFLRKQLTSYHEHQIRPRRQTNAARFSLVVWSRLFAWRSTLLVVKPATLIGWHRKAFRLFWKRKSRPGRRPIPLRLRQLIEQMVSKSPFWGEERIAHELLLKLGIRVSPRTVRAYWPAKDPRGPIANRRTGAHLSATTPGRCLLATSWSPLPLASASFISLW